MCSITCTFTRCTDESIDKNCLGAVKGDFVQWIPDLPLLNGHGQWSCWSFFPLWIRMSPITYLCMLEAASFPYNYLLSDILMWTHVSAFLQSCEEIFFPPFSAVILHKCIALKCLELFFFRKISGSFETDF